MAGESIAGALLGTAVSDLVNIIKPAITRNWQFKTELDELQETITTIKPIFNDMAKLNTELNRQREETEKFINLLKQADDLVQNCEFNKLDFLKRDRHASKLVELNRSLKQFVKFHLQLQNCRDVKETLVEVRGLKRKLERGSASSWLFGVPLMKCVAIEFDERVRVLKGMVVKDSVDGDCAVVVVSGVGGCGKTTLVTMMCHDPEIKEKFGRNIYFATISKKYDKKVIIKGLLERKLGKLRDFDSDEVAVQQWGSFLGENESEILLVLDDVWSPSVIMDFKFMSPGYKILVTSRTAFTPFSKYQLRVLNDQDATRLFRRSAFSENVNEHSNIQDDLVEKLVKCCKNHPLALSVIGGMLNGEHVASWEVMLKKLSEGKKTLLDLDESIKSCLKRSLFFFKKEPEMKQCFLDLGLFPEDQKIAATTLMDMWAHLYKHDGDGLLTMDIIAKLSSKNLATLLPIRKHLPAIANHCEEEYVMQHDMMKELAIHLCSQKSIEHRERLIINVSGQDLPQLPPTINARILSISTDERFSLEWNEIQFPKVEVFVLNFMSTVHSLPQFMETMQRLKVLIITNYGYYFSEIQNLPSPQYLSSLTTIRLDHVSISSISTTILMLENLQKLSLIMCKIGNSFNKGVSNKLTSLSEMDIESCDDFVTFPTMLCNLVRLKKLSITNCHELTSISEQFGKLTNLEVLRLASCSKLTALPESTRNLKKLRIIDLSHCLSLLKLPKHIGELNSLKIIDAMGCTGLDELPKSVKDFHTIKVVCDEETSRLWSDFQNVKVEVIEEDTLDTFFKIIPREYIYES